MFYINTIFFYNVKFSVISIEIEAKKDLSFVKKRSCPPLLNSTLLYIGSMAAAL